ncbi:thioredoxin family protein [Phnomibacter ginsenosidimutans]|jgi:thiol-disulfide isomerase/thioredoxin|uniref:Thioredoxin family protein n=1 Tax=Phnomibacter ginsenosidimutans TaxID=2676868 RepID=A0A6I6GAK5_9BACT|nr:thioredoxin family protein [Phnomibacter ginsenosidimutans]QGW27140.1 hypothetical protein GLV81_02625 [Phnomibacter ginsenosidimutans]
MTHSPLRKWMFFALFLVVTQQVFAQQKLYEVLPDAEEKKLFRGIVTLQDIKGDSSFTWYKQNLQYYRNNAALVDAFKQKKGQFQLVIFAGTWCHDSQQIIPKYFSCLEAAGIPDSAFTIVAADRNKTTVGNLHQLFGITLVPTVIVMKEGKEVGRITEYGKTGLPDAELATIIAAL